MSLEIFKTLFHRSYDLVEACNRQNLDEDMLEPLRERLKTTKFVPKCLISSQLLMFLNAAKGDIELAAQKLEKYYEVKHECPEFFKNRNLDSEEVQQALDCLMFVSLPITPDNCMMMVPRLRKFNPKDYNFDAALKTFIMKCEATTYKHGPRDGIIFFDDLDGVSIFHLFRPSLNSIRKGMKFLQEASPMEPKAIHIMNSVPFINRMIAIAKPFLQNDMLNRVHFHPPNMNYDDLQSIFGIPKSILPSDYGGDLDSLEEMHIKQRAELMELRDYFIMEEAHMNYEYDQYFDEFEKVRTKKLPIQIKDYTSECDETTKM